VFSGLEDGVDYWVSVSAETSKGEGPASERLSLRPAGAAVRAPLGVDAAATSQHSVEVWWEALPGRGKVVGYQVSFLSARAQQRCFWILTKNAS